MNIEQILMLGSARGIDLQHIAGAESNLYGLARERRRNEFERESGIAIRRTAVGNSARVTRAAAHGAEDYAWVMSGAPVRLHLAVVYSVRGDPTTKESDDLKRLIMHFILNRCAKGGWPRQLRLYDGTVGPVWGYTEPLAQLVMDEDRHRPYFTAWERSRLEAAVGKPAHIIPSLHAHYLQLSNENWDGIGRRMFEEVATEYQGWLAGGIAYGKRRSRGDGEVSAA